MFSRGRSIWNVHSVQVQVVCVVKFCTVPSKTVCSNSVILLDKNLCGNAILSSLLVEVDSKVFMFRCHLVLLSEKSNLHYKKNVAL